MFNAVTRSVNQLVKLNTLKRIESSSKWCLPASKRNLINALHEIKLIDRLEQQKSFVNRFDNELRLLLNCGQQSDANQEADFRLEDHVRNEILTDLRQIEEELHELIRLQQNESDQLEQLIHDECGHLNQKVTDLLDRVVDLLTVDRLDHVQEVVVELEHAVGGQESMLFVKEMNNFYVQFASQNGWKVLSNHFPSESG